MNTTLLIGTTIIISLVVIIAIHSWVHKLISFKMDESAVLNYLSELSKDSGLGTMSSKHISKQTNLPEARINDVCQKSKAISLDPANIGNWILKTNNH